LYNSWFIKQKKWVGRSKEGDWVSWLISKWLYMLNTNAFFYSHFLHCHLFLCQ
jgi:hypothetical protein